MDQQEKIRRRKARSKVTLDPNKTYTYGWPVPSNIKVGDIITVQRTFGCVGLKSSLSTCDRYNYTNKDGIVLELETRVTRILNQSDLSDISSSYSTEDYNSTESEENSESEQSKSEEWE